MKPTVEQLRAWTKQRAVHPYYKQAVEYAENMEVHALGKYPDKLIGERRPSESEEIQKFRKKIYVSPTEGTWGKIFNSLTKIRKAHDFVYHYDSSSVPARIAEDETPKVYLEQRIPTFGSIDNWFWSVAFQKMLIDSNAIAVVLPMSWDIVPNEYVKPYPVIFTSSQVIDYVKEQWYFIKSDEIVYFSEGRSQRKGSVYYYIDGEVIIRYQDTDSKGGMTAIEYPHGLGRVPVCSLRGIVEQDSNLYTLNRSRLHPVMAWMNEAVREYSDLQAGVLQSMFPTYWFYQAQKCGACSGTGYIRKADAAPVKCTDCSGQGTMPFNPYQHVSINLKPQKADELAVPTPPGGIIEKDTAVIAIQDKRIEQHLYRALATVNMEHLSSVPLAQSGVAKEWDRAEANNFVYTIAEDAVRVLDEVIGLIIDYRYMTIVPNNFERYALRPRINVPSNFDISSDATMAADIKAMKEAKFNPATIAAAERDYVQRRFVVDNEVKELMEAIYELDALAGMSNEDIIIGLANNLVSRESAVIHWNIKGFIDRAMDEDQGFMAMDEADQMQVLRGYAQEVIAQGSPSARVLAMQQNQQSSDTTATDNAA